MNKIWNLIENTFSTYSIWEIIIAAILGALILRFIYEILTGKL